MKGSRECPEYVAAGRCQGVVLQVCAWNVKNLYRAGSLTSVVRGLVRFGLDLAAVQKVGWEKRCTVLAEDFEER